MKKLRKISVLVLTLIFCLSVPFGAFASADVTTNTEIEYFDDGSYLVTKTVESIAPFSSGTKNHSKAATYYNSDDEKQWTAYLKTTFTYTGSSATCVSATATYTIHVSAWKMTESYATRLGRKATGTFTAKKYWLGIITNTIPIQIITTCDNNGNIS